MTTSEEIIEFVESLEGALTLTPAPGDESPEIAWGDSFFYYSRDGVTPSEAQPFATIVTKDYPGDTRSRLDRDRVVRVNVAAGKEAFVRWTGHAPGVPADDADLSIADTVFAHPVYGSLGWLAVVNPGSQTGTATRELLHHAYDLARSRAQRRTGHAAD